MGRLDLCCWLHTEIKGRLWDSNPDTVTHPSTSRAQRRLTLLFETNDATTTPRRHDQRHSIALQHSAGRCSRMQCRIAADKVAGRD